MKFTFNPGKSLVEEYLTKLMLEHWPKPIEISEAWIDECTSSVVESSPAYKPKPYWRQKDRW